VYGGHRPLADAQAGCQGGGQWSGVLLLVRPSAAALGELVRRQAGCDLTYPEVAATAGAMPPGYRHDRWEVDLGAFDDDALRRLATVLRHWRRAAPASSAVPDGGRDRLIHDCRDIKPRSRKAGQKGQSRRATATFR
jgi:hypothetical protein